MSQKVIGVFDSGVGGLSVLKRLIKDFPNESFVYLGDTARLPYGTKSKETIISYVNRNIDFLQKNFDIKAIVIACNSASSVLPFLKFDLPVLGVIKAGAGAALKTSLNKKISLWATRTTVKLDQYSSHMSDEVSLNSVACPLLVSLVEEELGDSKIARSMFEHYIKPVIEHGSDTLILGCTHFPFLKEELLDFFKEKNLKLHLVDASIEISSQLNNLISQTSSDSQEIKILFTDGSEQFKKFAVSQLPQSISFDFEMVDI